MNSLGRVAAALLVPALLQVATAPAEYVDLQTSVRAGPGLPVTNGFYGTAPDLTNGPATCVTSVDSNNAAAQGTFGLARVHVYAHDGGRVAAYAGWEDSLTIVPDDAGLIGQSADVQCDLVFTGEIAATDSSFGTTVNYAYLASLAGGTMGPVFGSWSSGGGYSGFPLGAITNYGFGTTFGTPFVLSAYISMEAEASSEGGAVDANFARWAQSIVITSINGPGGPVNGYTVVASSGLSWRGPYLSPPADLTAKALGPDTISVNVDSLLVGFTNVLEESTDMHGTNWTGLADCTWASGSTTVVIQADSTPTRFFRLRSF